MAPTKPNRASTNHGCRVDADKCMRCGETAYAAERTMIDGDVFHVSCFKCDCCARKLALDKFYKWSDGKYYCSHHDPQFIQQLCASDKSAQDGQDDSDNACHKIQTIDEEMNCVADHVAEIERKMRQTEGEAGKAVEEQAGKAVEEEAGNRVEEAAEQRNPSHQDSILSTSDEKVCEEILLSNRPSNIQQDKDGYYDLENLTLDLVNILPTEKSQRLLMLLGAREGKVMHLELEIEGLRGELSSLRSTHKEFESPNVLSRGIAAKKSRIRTSALPLPFLVCLAFVSSLLVGFKVSMLVQKATCSLEQNSEHEMTNFDALHEERGRLRQWLCASVGAAEQAEKEKVEQKAEQESLIRQWTEEEEAPEAMVKRLRLDSKHRFGPASGIAGILGTMYFLGFWPSSVTSLR